MKPKPWRQAQIWANLVMATLAFVPGFVDWADGNKMVPAVILSLVNLVFLFLGRKKPKAHSDTPLDFSKLVEVKRNGPTLPPHS